MKCTLCKTGESHPGKVTVTVERAGHMFVARQVPALVCEDCGEYYLDEPTAHTLYRRAEDSFQRHAEVEIQTFAVA